MAMWKKLTQVWRSIRQLSGDDAYERYLQHYAEHHAQAHIEAAHLHQAPLSREAFFKQWQDNQWKGVKRCC